MHVRATTRTGASRADAVPGRIDSAALRVSLTDALPAKLDNPIAPVAIEEQPESAHAAVEAGATTARRRLRDEVGATVHRLFEVGVPWCAA